MQSKTLKYLSYGSTAGLIAMMMAASVIERLRGAETAQALIYHHPVFFVFWAVAAVSGLALLVRRIGRKRCHGKDRMPRKEFPMKGKSILGKTAGVIGSGPGGR